VEILRDLKKCGLTESEAMQEQIQQDQGSSPIFSSEWESG